MNSENAGGAADPVPVGQEIEGALEDRCRPEGTEQVKHDLYLADTERGPADVPPVGGELERSKRVLEGLFVSPGREQGPRQGAAGHRDIERVVELDIACQQVLQQRGCRRRVGHGEDIRGDPADSCCAACIADFLVQVDRLRADRLAGGRVASDDPRMAEVEQRFCEATWVTQAAGQVDLLFIEGICRRDVPSPPGDASGPVEQRQPSRRPSVDTGYRQDALDRGPAFLDVSAALPEPPHRTDEPLRELHLSLRDRPVQRGAEVVVLL